MSDDALLRLAAAAGLIPQWIDYRGLQRTVEDSVLRAILGALEIPCATPEQVRDSLTLIDHERASRKPPAMIIAESGQPARAALAPDPAMSLAYRVISEDGEHHEGVATRESDGDLGFTAIERIGYYHIEVCDEAFTLAVVPPRCFSIHDLSGQRRPWGLTTQLYALRRGGDGGIGDFTGLAQFARAAALHGADAVAVSPMHALFSADPERFSPYSPSSRLFLNALHADPSEVCGEALLRELVDAANLAGKRSTLEALPLIDWPEAARSKLDLLRRLHARLTELPPESLQDFKRYCNEAGPALRDHATFEALHAHFFAGESPQWSWHDWPEAYRASGSAEVAAFAGEHAGEVEFHCFLQWLADRGLRKAQAAARDAGMSIGLIGDLAVGTDSSGSHGWSRRHDMLIGASVGAPPDLINALGQNWGLTAFSPRALRLHGYAPFLEMLRAQLRHVGGLRIDHVLGLGRLWLVPEGARATEGVYLRYPIDDLFRLIALESWRHRAIIIGEDMGTVSEGFRDRLAAAGILGTRVLWFERDWGLFVEPARWPVDAVAMTTTHDLPTVGGWWRGRDIDWRARLNLFGPHASETTDRAERVEDRSRLWAAFRNANVASGEQPADDDARPVIDAAAAFIARTPSPLALLPVEDALGLIEQPNIPGTIDEHPNWRRRLPVDVDVLLDAPEVKSCLHAIDQVRRGG